MRIDKTPHVLSSRKMSLDKEELKEIILNYLVYNERDEASVDLFIDELFEELSGEKTNLSFHKGLGDLSLSINNWNRSYEENRIKLSKKLEKFMEDYLTYKDCLTSVNDFLGDAQIEYHLQRGELVENHDDKTQGLYRWTHSLYDIDPEDGIVSFEETVRRFEEGMLVLHEVLNIESSLSHKKSGRPKSWGTYTDFIAFTSVLCECFLDLKIKKTNNENDQFYQVISCCFRLAQEQFDTNENSINLGREIQPCFSDYSVVKSMGHYYKKYDRLDLYIEHVKRTNQVDCVIGYFEDEWSGWKKPNNYQSLIAMTKTA